MRVQVLSVVLLSSLVLAQQPRHGRDGRSHLIRRQVNLLDPVTARAESDSASASPTSTLAADDPESLSTSAATVSSSTSISTSAAASITSSSATSSSTSTSATSSAVTSSAPVTTSASQTSSTVTSAPVTTTAAATPTSESSSTAVALTTTDSAGGVVTVIKSISNSKAASSASSSSTSAKASSSGLSTGAIIGISVVAGVAALAGGLFLVYRLTSKRFSGFDDEGDDAIRWPELNKHGESDDMGSVALPARPTGGAGLRTNALDGEDSDDGHEPSANSSNTHMDPTLSSGAHSTEDYTSYPPQSSTNYYEQQGGYPQPDPYDSYGQQQGAGAYGGAYAGGGYSGYDDDEAAEAGQGQAGVGALGRSRSTGASGALDSGAGIAMSEVARPPATGGWASGGAGDDPYAVAGVSRRI